MKLFTLPKYGTGTGLHRVERMLRVLGVPVDWLPPRTIAVTGSNGKGSTTVFTAALGRAHGLKTGQFISPHLHDPRERIQINGEMIAQAALDSLEEEVFAAVRRLETELPGEQMGSFEALFSLACAYFHREACDLLVLEAGIGGRFDPVRVAGARVAAVASLDLEHTELLGSSLEAICLDKTDICSSPGRVFYGRSALPLAVRIETYCRLRGLRPAFVGRELERENLLSERNSISFVVCDESGMRLPLRLPFAGAFQADNALLSLAVFRCWSEQAGVTFSAGASAAVLSEVRFPGRVEPVHASPLVVIDVGHTPAAVHAAAQAILAGYPKASWILVTGVSYNKKIDEILRILVPFYDDIICTCAYHKGAPAEEIGRIARELAPEKQVSVAPTIEDAVRLALQRARELGKSIAVQGGLFLAVEFAEAVHGRDPRALRFY